ncbi:MAG: long-chain-fatty-acid--CoA ligase [Actinomycetota bacterium]
MSEVVRFWEGSRFAAHPPLDLGSARHTGTGGTTLSKEQQASNAAAPLRSSAAGDGSHIALIYQDRSISYADLDSRVDRVTAALTSVGVRKGDRVALMIQNIPAFVETYYGILRTGAVAVPMNIGYTPDEVAHILSDSEARALIVADPFAGVVDGLRETLPMLEHVVVVGGTRTGTISYDQFLNMGDTATDADCAEDDLACLVYTSGTTGRPKGAMLSHGNLLSNLEQMSQVPLLQAQESDVVLLVLPLFHIYALNVCLGLAIREGATALLLERFDAVGSLDQVEKHGVTVLYGAPPMYSAWLNTPGTESRDLSKVRLAVSGAAALPASVMEAFRDRLGITIWEGYGLTETSPALTSNAMGDEAKPGSIGRALPGVEIRLVDEDGEDVVEGDPGEIVTRGPNIFQGYWRRDQDTKEAFRSGWFHTGDVAYRDEDGYLFIVDRKKDLIIVSGFNVYPREVEEVLLRHPKVAEVAVVGVAHPYSGEAVKAVIVLTEGASATEEEFDDFSRRHLARFKCPSVIEFASALPHTMTGKVLRRALRED